MSDIRAGVVVVTKFVSAGSKEFRNYINYIDRENAVRNDNADKYTIEKLKEEAFKGYMDYMGNPKKTTDLFTNEKLNLSSEEKQNLKEVFELAQKNNSAMWQTVISFDNRWLEQNSIYNSETKTLDENKLKECARGCMSKMLSKELLSDSTVWSGAIHYNTDNIHIHIATIEPIPTRERIKEGKYKGEVKGRFKQSSIEAGKSFVVNNILNQQQENQKINDLIRKDILQAKKSNPLIQDTQLCYDFINLYQSLPADRRQWNYNMNSLKSVRPLIDKISNDYLEKYHTEEFKELKNLLSIQNEKYKTAYGEGYNRNYSETKLADLMQRLGNSILKECKLYDKEYKKELFTALSTQSEKDTRVPHKQSNKSFDSAKISFVLENAIRQLKKALKSDFEQHYNMNVYLNMQKETEI